MRIGESSTYSKTRLWSCMCPECYKFPVPNVNERRKANVTRILIWNPRLSKTFSFALNISIQIKSPRTLTLHTTILVSCSSTVSCSYLHSSNLYEHPSIRRNRSAFIRVCHGIKQLLPPLVPDMLRHLLFLSQS